MVKSDAYLRKPAPDESRTGHHESSTSPVAEANRRDKQKETTRGKGCSAMRPGASSPTQARQAPFRRTKGSLEPHASPAVAMGATSRDRSDRVDGDES